jgi:hypothetical protein
VKAWSLYSMLFILPSPSLCLILNRKGNT